MSDGFEKKKKEVAVAFFSYYPAIHLQGLRKTTKTSI
jgi:hypothetical protein